MVALLVERSDEECVKPCNIPSVLPSSSPLVCFASIMRLQFSFCLLLFCSCSWFRTCPHELWLIWLLVFPVLRKYILVNISCFTPPRLYIPPIRRQFLGRVRITWGKQRQHRRKRTTRSDKGRKEERKAGRNEDRNKKEEEKTVCRPRRREQNREVIGARRDRKRTYLEKTKEENERKRRRQGERIGKDDSKSMKRR